MLFHCRLTKFLPIVRNFLKITNADFMCYLEKDVQEQKRLLCISHSAKEPNSTHVRLGGLLHESYSKQADRL